MEFLIMTNTQTCGIVGNCRSSIFGCGLRTEGEKKIRILARRKLRFGGGSYAMSKEESKKPLVGSGILEKELEFKPAFDEYLKAMESVKSGRHMKQLEKSDRYRSKDASKRINRSRTSIFKRDDKNVRSDKIERYANREMVSKPVNDGGLNGNVNMANRPEGEFGSEKSVIRKPKEKVIGKKGSDGRWYNNINNGVEKVIGKKGSDGRWYNNINNGVEADPKDFNLSKSTNFHDGLLENVDDERNRNATIYRRGKYVQDKSSSKSFRMLDSNFVRLQKANDNGFKRSSQKLIRSGKSVFEKYDADSLEVDRAAFNTFEEGDDVVDKPRVPRMEMEERIQRLARRLNGADIDMPEWMFSKTMRSAQIRFSDHSILRVIQILGKLGNWRRVIQVIEWLQMCERFKSHKLRFIYTTALNVLGKARRPVEALNVFHAMQQQMSSYPDLVAYHCIAVTLGQAGHLKELFDVIDSMRSLPKKKFKTITQERWDPRLEPDIVVYNAVLNACARRKQWEGAFWVLEQLKKQGQKPSATTYGLVMEVMFASGKYNLVHEFFRKVQKSFIPNALAYKVLLNTLWREGKTDEAVLAVQDMERQGIVGSAALYYDLARCLCSAGRCEEALMQMEKICKVANKPLVVTYTGLIQACLESRNIENAAYIFNKMRNFCSPNLVTCNIMLKAYLEHGWFEEAKKLFQKMLENSNQIRNESDYKVLAIPDTYSFNTMLDACNVEKRWEDLEHVYSKMLHYGYHFNAKRHLRMILDASRAGKVELLETTWMHLAQSGRLPPPPLIKERFCIMLEREDYVSALSCITNHPVNELRDFSKIGWSNLLNENSLRFQDDALVRVIHEAKAFAHISNVPNPALQNLISACKEFLETKTADSEKPVRLVISEF